MSCYFIQIHTGIGHQQSLISLIVKSTNKTRKGGAQQNVYSALHWWGPIWPKEPKKQAVCSCNYTHYFLYQYWCTMNSCFQCYLSSPTAFEFPNLWTRLTCMLPWATHRAIWEFRCGLQPEGSYGKLRTTRILRTVVLYNFSYSSCSTSISTPAVFVAAQSTNTAAQLVYVTFFSVSLHYWFFLSVYATDSFCTCNGFPWSAMDPTRYRAMGKVGKLLTLDILTVNGNAVTMDRMGPDVMPGDISTVREQPDTVAGAVVLRRSSLARGHILHILQQCSRELLKSASVSVDSISLHALYVIWKMNGLHMESWAIYHAYTAYNSRIIISVIIM